MTSICLQRTEITTLSICCGTPLSFLAPAATLSFRPPNVVTSAAMTSTRTDHHRLPLLISSCMIRIAGGWPLRVEKKKEKSLWVQPQRSETVVGLQRQKKEGTLVTPTRTYARMQKGTESIITFPSIFCNSIGQACR